MDSNIADPMHFCVYIFISLHMSLHTGDALFMNVDGGKWERKTRGRAELQNSYVLLL